MCQIWWSVANSSNRPYCLEASQNRWGEWSFPDDGFLACAWPRSGLDGADWKIRNRKCRAWIMVGRSNPRVLNVGGWLFFVCLVTIFFFVIITGRPVSGPLLQMEGPISDLLLTYKSNKGTLLVLLLSLWIRLIHLLMPPLWRFWSCAWADLLKSRGVSEWSCPWSAKNSSQPIVSLVCESICVSSPSVQPLLDIV